MKNKPFTSVIIPAGGSGNRMKSAHNKLLMPLGKDSVLGLTLSVFDSSETTDEIIIAVPVLLKDSFSEIIKKTVKNKPFKIAEGGFCRESSVFNGIKAADNRCDFISVHDAARPLITFWEIDKIHRLAYEKGNICAGTEVKNTVKITENGKIKKTLQRDCLFSAATPQVFIKENIEAALEKFKDTLDSFTDDSSLAEAAGFEVSVYYCDEKNIKITTPEDIKTAEKFLGI